MNYGVASFSSYLKCICHLYMSSLNNHYNNKKAPEDCGILLKVITLNEHGQVGYTYLAQGQDRSHMVGWKHLIHPDNPTMNGWTIGDSPSTNPALGGVPVGVPMGSRLSPWV